MARLATVLAFLLVPTVVFFQQCDHRAPPPPAPAQPASLGATDETDQFSLMARMMVKIYHYFRVSGSPQDARSIGTTISQQLDAMASPPGGVPLGPPHDPGAAHLNRLRGAIAAGELLGDEEAARRIEAIAAEIAPATSQEPGADSDTPPTTPPADSDNSPPPPSLDIAPDLEPLRLVYGGRASELSEADRDRLVARHGWWARVALTRGMPDSDPERARLLGGGGRILAALVLAGVVMLAGLFASIGCFIAVLVMLGGGRMRRRFAPPAPGGSVYLETLVVFILSFVALRFIAGAAMKYLHVSEAVALSMHWLLVAVPLWPLVRGVPFAEHRRMIGWHSGRGVVREVGAGVLGYFAGLVPFFLATLVSFVIVVFKMFVEKAAGVRSVPPRNPIIDEILNGGLWQIVSFAALATVWAPIVEEAVFRGSLFRHLRARWSLLGAGALSALVFGLMHQYPIYLLLPVITLGFCFALMREWRGSLIAPMVAHALHNGTLVTLLTLLLSVMRD